MSLVSRTKIEEVHVVSIILCLSIDMQLSKKEDRGFVSSKEMKDKE